MLRNSSAIKMDHNISQREAYNILRDSTYMYEYGSACYYELVRPIGEDAAMLLAYHKQYDLLWEVLDGNNKEGKVSALKVLLLERRKGNIIFDEQEKSRIRDFLNSDTHIRVCAGCIVSTVPLSAIIEEDWFKQLINDAMKN